MILNLKDETDSAIQVRVSFAKCGACNWLYRVCTFVLLFIAEVRPYQFCLWFRGGVLRGLICFDNDGTHVYCDTCLYSDTQWELENNMESIYAWSIIYKRLSEYSATLVWPATPVPRMHRGGGGGQHVLGTVIAGQTKCIAYCV